ILGSDGTRDSRSAGKLAPSWRQVGKLAATNADSSTPTRDETGGGKRSTLRERQAGGTSPERGGDATSSMQGFLPGGAGGPARIPAGRLCGAVRTRPT